MQPSHSRLQALFLVIFIDTLGYFIVMLAIKQLVPSSLVSVTLMLSPLAFIIFSPIVGRLSDKIGRKRSILYCLVASLLGFVIPLIGIKYQQTWAIMLGRFIAGLGTTSQPIAQASIADFSSGKKKAFNLGLIGLSMTLAMVLGPLAAGHLNDVATPYWIGTVLSLVNIALLLTSFSETHTPIKHDPPTSERGWRLLNTQIILVMLSFFCGELIWSGYYQAAYLGFLHSEFNQTASQLTIFIATIGLCMCLGLTVLYPLWLKISSIYRVGLSSMALFTVLFIPLLIHNQMYMHWAMVPFIALLVGTFYPSILHTISDLTPAHSQGWMLGIASQLLGAAWMITVFCIGFNSQLIALLCILLGCVACLTFTLSGKKNANI
jgi:MFS transporter, DHA1 family, tetracycline resistance protein